MVDEVHLGRPHLRCKAPPRVDVQNHVMKSKKNLKKNRRSGFRMFDLVSAKTLKTFESGEERCILQAEPGKEIVKALKESFILLQIFGW